jgi:hypothetical protein
MILLERRRAGWPFINRVLIHGARDGHIGNVRLQSSSAGVGAIQSEKFFCRLLAARAVMTSYTGATFHAGALPN